LQSERAGSPCGGWLSHNSQASQKSHFEPLGVMGRLGSMGER